jgi:hypothetical protein
MTDNDILRAAIECQLLTTGNREGFYSEALIFFAKLVAAQEREECAKFFDDNDTNIFWGSQAAQQIRARSNT